jgi:hypothetical protein
MPQIYVTAATREPPHAVVMWRERVTLADFESNHFTAQLIERLRWAVGDSHAAEQTSRAAGNTGDINGTKATAPERS